MTESGSIIDQKGSRMYRFCLIFMSILLITQQVYAEPFDGLEKVGPVLSFQDDKKATLEVLALKTEAGTPLVGLYFGDAHVYLEKEQWRALSGLLQYGSEHWQKLDYTGVDGVQQIIGYKVKTVGTLTPQLEGGLKTPDKRLVLVATGKYATADFKRFEFDEALLQDFISKVGVIAPEE
jgi:hypothetical protein